MPTKRRTAEARRTEGGTQHQKRFLRRPPPREPMVNGRSLLKLGGSLTQDTAVSVQGTFCSWTLVQRNRNSHLCLKNGSLLFLKNPCVCGCACMGAYGCVCVYTSTTFSFLLEFFHNTKLEKINFKHVFLFKSPIPQQSSKTQQNEEPR